MKLIQYGKLSLFYPKLVYKSQLKVKVFVSDEGRRGRETMMVRGIDIDADNLDEARKFGVVVTNFPPASKNRILFLEDARSQIPLELHFGGSNNVVDLRSARLPHGTIRFFGDDAVFISQGDARNARIDVYAHTRSRVTIESPKAIHGLKAVAYNGSSIVIGPGCLIAENTLIMTSDHHSIIDLDTGRQLNHPADVRLDGDIWLGWGSTILKGVTIGRGSIVAAHAVVTGDIGIAEIWAGVPARRMKRRVSWVASHPANPYDVDLMMRNLDILGGMGPVSGVASPQPALHPPETRVEH